MRTFYLRNSKGFPIACVATDLVKTQWNPSVPTDLRTDVVYSIAIWNKKDRFNKKLAHDVAEGRLKALTMDGNFPLQPHVKRVLLQHIVDHHKIGKIRDAAQLLLDRPAPGQFLALAEKIAYYIRHEPRWSVKGIHSLLNNQ